MKLKVEIITEQNKLFDARYNRSNEKIKAYLDTAKHYDDNFSKLFCAISKRVLFYVTIEAMSDLSVAAYQEMMDERFTEILPENYESCYANPDFAESCFPKMGGLLSFFYSRYRFYQSYACEHLRFMMAKYNQILLDCIEQVNAGKTADKNLRPIIVREMKAMDQASLSLNTLKSYDPSYSDNYDIIMNSDLNDTSYLYKFGEYISDNEIKTAAFLKNYSDQKISNVAKSIVDNYVRGFELDHKDISIKETFTLYFNLGQEKLTREIVKLLEAKNLKPVLNVAMSTNPNKQYQYDLRFTDALYFDQSYADRMLELNRKVFEEYKTLLKKYAGPIYIDRFGEIPFSPKSKDTCLKLSEEQQKIKQNYSNSYRKMLNEYVPSTERSFCIVALPTPEIGERFGEIFEDTLDVNMADTFKFEAIQQKLVDTMDKAEFVHVKGSGKNRTDIKVKMQKIADPDKHTNFLNCGAGVNIPVGEVFTSPALKGTNGILHVSEIYLNHLYYIDLEVEFVDGIAVKYTCKNFNDEEKNVKFVQENLMFPHKSLPLGEFAIGTNTLAYVMAKKYNILDKLPILIVEKMGPHFALGDTCFSWEEDHTVTNPIDGKKITAKDNEMSILRKEDIQKAYTGCHTDITVPYDELELIRAVTADGKSFDVLKDGRFVVPGTEALNDPLDRMN